MPCPPHSCASPPDCSVDDARRHVEDLGPTLGFLVAVLVLARLCAAQGLFAWAGWVLATAARGRPTALLGWVIAVGAAVTTMLSLDATVVLFTPIVIATAAAAGLAVRPYLHTCVHVANSASLLLPVANLTNLLVLERPAAEVPTPRLAIVVLIATLAGFLLSDLVHVHPGFVAAGGATVLAVPTLRAERARPRDLLAAADPLFLAFVAGLAVVVGAASSQGLDEVFGPLVDHDPSLLGLLTVAAVGAIAANLLNNLPAVLLLLPLVLPAGGPAAVLALLIGVNVGPNLTYVGSLATMLWLRVSRQGGVQPSLADFTRHALWTTIPAIAAATVALWIAVQLVGI
ncbi:MAG: ArsB/NhaD family transporter [Sporichthyaceae bacterium]